MRARSWRIPTWLIVVWALIFGLLAAGDLISEGSPEGLACLWGYCAGVSLWSWAVGMVPLGLLWYATRPGVSRFRIGVAALVTIVILVGLVADRQWPEDVPSVATGGTHGSIVDRGLVGSEASAAGASELVVRILDGMGRQPVRWSDGIRDLPASRAG